MSKLPITTTNTGLPSNVAGALAYLLGPLTGVIFLVIEKEDRFVRFHAAQSIVTGLVVIAASIALTLLTAILGVIPILGWIIGLFLSLGFGFLVFVGWILLMLRAYQGQEWEVPVASVYARKLLDAPSS
jgi:uncharacterized membrane protein